MKALLLCTGIAGAAAYLFIRLVTKRPTSLKLSIETFLAGVGVCAGTHLMYCGFVPSSLVEVRDAKGVLLQPPDIDVEMDDLHTVHLCVGGIATVYLSVLFIRNAIRKGDREKKRRRSEEVEAIDSASL